MTEFTEKFNFRNSKCHMNDIGYCKFEDNCRKEHAKNVCTKKNCKKDCNSRHPIPCKYKIRCKFHAKNVCAFSHAKAKAGSDDKNSNHESDLVNLKREVESLKNENEKKQVELDKVEKEVKALKEIKIVTTALIKDVEEKDEQISNLDREIFTNRKEIISIKEETKETNDALKNLKEQFAKDWKEIKVVIARLIQNVEEKDNKILELEKATSTLKLEIDLLNAENDTDKHKCGKSKAEEKCKKCNIEENSKTNLEKNKENVHSNLSNFRFDFVKPSEQTKKQTNILVEKESEKYMLECCHCTFKYSNVDELEKHIKSYHAKKK